MIRFKRYEKHWVCDNPKLSNIEHISYLHCALAYNTISVRLNSKKVLRDKVRAEQNLVTFIMVYSQGCI